MNKNNYSGSEEQEGDISMKLDDDKSDDVRQDSCAGEDFGSEGPVVDKNVGEEYSRSQPSTSRNEGRKRLSQSSCPCTEKVSRTVCEVEHQPQEDISIHESELLKTSAGASSITNVMTVRYAENVINEPSVIHCPVKSEEGSVRDAENIKNEPPIIQGPVKFGSVMLSNDCKDDSKANISPASTSSDEVEILTEVRTPIVWNHVVVRIPTNCPDMALHESELLETSVGESGPANVVTEVKTENIKDEPPIIQCPVKCEDEPGMLSHDCKDHSEANIPSTSTSSDDVTLVKEIRRIPVRNRSIFTFSVDYVPLEKLGLPRTSAGGSGLGNVTVPNAGNIKQEPPAIQGPVKCEDESGVLSNNGKDCAETSISSVASSSDEVKILGTKTHSNKKQFYLPYEKFLKCDKCGKIFPHEKYLMEHRSSCN